MGPNLTLVPFYELRLYAVLRSPFWVLAEDFHQSHDGARAENYTLRAIFVRNGHKCVALSIHPGKQMNGRR